MAVCKTSINKTIISLNNHQNQTHPTLVLYFFTMTTFRFMQLTELICQPYSLELESEFKLCSLLLKYYQ